MAKEYSKECSIVAYYFSKYDDRAIKALGYKNQNEAFQEVAKVFGKKATFVKLRRDEFDAIVSSVRKGWWKRLPAKGNWLIHCELKMLSFDQLTDLVRATMNSKIEKDKDKPDIKGTQKKRRIKITSDNYHEVKVRGKKH